MIAEHYPEHYAKLLDKVTPMAERGATVASMSMAIYELNAALAAQQLPKANVANAISTLRLAREQGAAALNIEPGYCLDVLGLRKPASAPGLSMSKALVERELVLMADMLEQTALAPEQVPAPVTEAQVSTIALAAYDALPADELRLAMGRIGGDASKATDPIGQTALCEFSLAMFDQVLKLPSLEASQLFRGMSAGK